MTAELQTAIVDCLQRKIQLFLFSTHPDASPSQLIAVSGVQLYLKVLWKGLDETWQRATTRVLLSVVGIPAHIVAV